MNAALRTLFALATHAPASLRLMRPFAVRATLLASPATRRATAANARRLLGRVPRGFGRHVVGSFYDVITDLGQAASQSAAALRQQVVAVEGKDAYLATRRAGPFAGRGAVLVTAHLGSFEVGLAALRDVERSVHVVFKRDPFGGFEALRHRVRQTLGVHEAAIDGGLPALLKLRDALRADGVAVLQADRALPGQKSAPVPFARGTLRLPLGPIKLAQSAGAPVVPVFAVREAAGRVRVYLDPAIDPTAEDALAQVAAAIERFVLARPEQWLVLHPAFVEDASPIAANH